jgi:hypothetical protein
MTNEVKRLGVLPLCSVAVAALGIIVGPAPALADNGCANGLVPRNARPGDDVCVTQQVAAQIAQENATATDLRQPGGGAYGPLTCKPGYVWREAFVGDGVCVTPDRRQETWNENAAGPGVTGAGPERPPPQLPNAHHPLAPNATTTTNPPPTNVGGCPPHCLPTGTAGPTNAPLPTPIAPPPQLPNPTPPPAPHATTTGNPPPTSVGPLPTSTVPRTTAAPAPVPAPPPPPAHAPPPPGNSCDPRVDICVH